MKTKLTRWFLPILVALFLMLSLVTPVLAIADPDLININAVYVYRNARETGDQLYLIDYTIDYTTPPDETAYEAYMCRLMEDSDEVKASAIYAYHEKGYGDGVIAIYISAANAPGWDGDYDMVLLGNPLLEWSGDPPEDSVASENFDLWQDNPMATTKLVVSSRILTLATALETSWGIDMVAEVTEEGKYVLTNYAIAYFSAVVPYFSDIAPYIYAEGQLPGQVVQPEIPDAVAGTDYADSLVDLITDTPFDLTEVADAFGVSRGALTALLYYGAVVLFAILAVRQIGSYKPIMLFSLPLVVIGAFVGVPMIVTILAGFLSLGMIAYVLFYKGSTA